MKDRSVELKLEIYFKEPEISTTWMIDLGFNR